MALARYFLDMEVVDADHDLRVFVNKHDLECAERGNPTECVFAKACKRLYGSRAILFFRSVAYVDLPDEEGIRRVYRFLIGRAAKNAIEKYDRTGEAHPGGFLLSAPRPSERIENKRQPRLREALTPNGDRGTGVLRDACTLCAQEIIQWTTPPCSSSFCSSCFCLVVGTTVAGVGGNYPIPRTVRDLVPARRRMRGHSG